MIKTGVKKVGVIRQMRPYGCTLLGHIRHVPLKGVGRSCRFICSRVLVDILVDVKYKLELYCYIVALVIFWPA